jgi:hypothetical protein
VARVLVIRNQWAAAYAVACGAELIGISPGARTRYVFNDEFGWASEAAAQWDLGGVGPTARKYAEAVQWIRRVAREVAAGTTQEGTTDGL